VIPARAARRNCPDGQSLLLESLDLNIHTSGKIELHQSIDRLLGRLKNVNQPLVRANLKSFT
jgi:hypothetical protein